MSITLVPETGSGSPTANSYASRADFHSYCEVRRGAPDNIDVEEIDAALIEATRHIDQELLPHGLPVVTGQALRFPRSGLFDRDGVVLSSTSIPACLVHATCEQALAIMSGDRTGNLDDKFVAARTIGAKSKTFAFYQPRQLLHEAATRLLGPLMRGARLVRA